MNLSYPRSIVITKNGNLIYECLDFDSFPCRSSVLETNDRLVEPHEITEQNLKAKKLQSI